MNRMPASERPSALSASRLAARVALLLVLCASLLPGSALAHVLYVCSMDGEVHRACCCDRDAPFDSATADAGDCGCCEVEISTPPPQDAGFSGHAVAPTPTAPPALYVLSLSIPAPSLRVPIEYPVARGPPPAPPPLWLTHQALLI